MDDEKTWFEQHIGRGWPGTISSLPSIDPWEETPKVESTEDEVARLRSWFNERFDGEGGVPDDAEAQLQNWLAGGSNV